MRDENIFRINLQDRHTKTVKYEDAEVATSIWNNTAAEVFQGGYRDKRHEPVLQHLRKIMAKCFKHNVVRRLVRYMVESYAPKVVYGRERAVKRERENWRRVWKT